MQKLDKSYLYDPKFEGEGTDYTYVIDASVDANAAKAYNLFKHKYIWMLLRI